MRTCAREGCPSPLDGLRADARYCGQACRSAEWRARTGYTLQASRKPYQTRIKRPARPSDVRLSYRTLLDVLARELNSPLRARDIAMQALTPRARARAKELGL